MPRGLSLHVGLNHVDPDCYSGWPGKLAGCIPDARNMQAVCQSQGFATELLLDEQCTSEAVLGQIAAAAPVLQAGDTFVFTYSGHGGLLPDPWGVFRTVSTLCLFERQVIGHELLDLWFRFRPGVRVVMVADSCHSGTVSREPMLTQPPSNGSKPRNMPLDVAQQVYSDHRFLYGAMLKGQTVPVPPCPVLLLGACQDDQTACDGARDGLFTEKLLQVWQGGAFAGSYHEFHQRITSLMPPYQSPSYFAQGPDDPTFLSSRPFSV